MLTALTAALTHFADGCFLALSAYLAAHGSNSTLDKKE